MLLLLGTIFFVIIIILLVFAFVLLNLLMFNVLLSNLLLHSWICLWLVVLWLVLDSLLLLALKHVLPVLLLKSDILLIVTDVCGTSRSVESLLQVVEVLCGSGKHKLILCSALRKSILTVHLRVDQILVHSWRQSLLLRIDQGILTFVWWSFGAWNVLSWWVLWTALRAYSTVERLAVLVHTFQGALTSYLICTNWSFFVHDLLLLLLYWCSFHCLQIALTTTCYSVLLHKLLLMLLHALINWYVSGRPLVHSRLLLLRERTLLKLSRCGLKLSCWVWASSCWRISHNSLHRHSHFEHFLLGLLVFDVWALWAFKVSHRVSFKCSLHADFLVTIDSKFHEMLFLLSGLVAWLILH